MLNHNKILETENKLIFLQSFINKNTSDENEKTKKKFYSP